VLLLLLSPSACQRRLPLKNRHGQPEKKEEKKKEKKKLATQQGARASHNYRGSAHQTNRLQLVASQNPEERK
jgi:hypothetical protein